MQWSIYPAADFPTYRQSWDDLNSLCGDSPLLDTDFVIPLLENFSTGKELLAVYGDGDSPEAMAIVNKTKIGAWATCQPSQAPVGLWLQKPGLSVSNLSDSLRAKLPGINLLFGLTQQDPEILPRPPQTRRLTTLDYIDTARVSVSGTFEDYWAARGKNLKQNLKRQRSRLAREETAVRFEVISDPELVDEGVRVYGELESVGWKAETNTAVHINNAQGQFYSQILQRFCQKKCGMIFQYYYDDRLVATDLCISNQECLVILKTTYDENIKTTSPAMLMRQDEFNMIFENKPCKRIEFYGKVMDWHTKWSSEIRTIYHINSYSALGSLLLHR